MKFFFYSLLLTIFLTTSNFIFAQSSLSLKLKNEALTLMNNGRYGEAIDLWNKYVSENPRKAEGFNFRGLCYEKRGNYESALYDYRTAKKLDPQNQEITSNLNRATNDWYKLLYNKIEGYKREIAINPNVAENYLEIGKCYKNLGDWEEAEIWYDTYLEKEEPSADEVIRYTEILAKNNHISKGEPILKTFTEKYPDDHRLWSRYGYFLLWLGKNKMAIQSFTKALEIRPYFKEAMDGLDLAKGKGYVYSINDTTSRFNYGLSPAPKVYIIDKYYRMIKNNPADDQTRFKLVEELIKVNRFEEAYQQLEFLSTRHNGEERFNELWAKVITLRKSYYAERIKYYEDLLSKNPDNKKALLELGKFYSYNKDYDLALNIYRNYLLKFPQDDEVRFRIVQILIWQNNLCDAQKEVELLLKIQPENTDYQLTAAKINYWLDDNLDESKMLFQKVLTKEPNNTDALASLINLEIRMENYEEAQRRISQLETVDKNYQELPQLKDNLEALRIRIENKKLQSILDNARDYASEENYDTSIKYFKDYLSAVNTNKKVSIELADVYLKKNDVKSAIKIFDELLLSGYDYDIDKQRAKIIFWQGDSTLALREFRKLVQKNPSDVEAKLFLGDAYLKTGQTQNARKVYEELLVKSPDSHIIKTRLSWIGGSSSFSLGNFPAYVQVIPQAFYFTDNTNFELNNFGLGVDVGLTNFVSIGVSGFRGALFSPDKNLRFIQAKGTANLKFNSAINTSVSFGQTYFKDNNKENIIDVSLTAQKKNVYSITGYMNYSDAAFILYSPYLVTTRLNAYYYGLNADYRFKNNFVLNAKYARIDVSDNKSGDQLQAMIGKIFENDITAGYEYYFYSFNDSTSLYWSPKNFESHALWVDVDLYKDEITSFTLGGKVGLIPQNDYVLSEFYASFSYRFTNSFSLNARFTTGSSSRSNVGYRSASIQAGLYWNL